MEVKIGVSDSARELTLSSAQKAEEVEAAVREALEGDRSGTLSLTDDKGRRFLVAAAKVAYVEIGAPDARKVGFGG